MRGLGVSGKVKQYRREEETSFLAQPLASIGQQGSTDADHLLSWKTGNVKCQCSESTLS